MNLRKGYSQVRQLTKGEMAEYGEFFKSTRLSLGLNLTQVAERIGVFRTTISLWEKGKCIPQTDIYLLELKYKKLKEEINNRPRLDKF